MKTYQFESVIQGNGTIQLPTFLNNLRILSAIFWKRSSLLTHKAKPIWRNMANLSLAAWHIMNVPEAIKPLMQPSVYSISRISWI